MKEIKALIAWNADAFMGERRIISLAHLFERDRLYGHPLA